MDTQAVTIESAVNLFLSERLTTFDAQHVGQGETDGWEHDAWKIIIRRAGVKNELKTDYRTGLGLRSRVKKRLEHLIKPRAVAPSAASVIHSLLLDSYYGSEIFPDFCADMGYDVDSIRARDTYHACQKTTLELRNIFSSSDLAALSELTSNF